MSTPAGSIGLRRCLSSPTLTRFILSPGYQTSVAVSSPTSLEKRRSSKTCPGTPKRLHIYPGALQGARRHVQGVSLYREADFLELEVIGGGAVLDNVGRVLGVAVFAAPGMPAHETVLENYLKSSWSGE